MTAFPDPLHRLGPEFQPFLGVTGSRRLNLGCGRMIWPGWVNVDRTNADGADLVCDLEGAVLPFADGSVSAIVACHVLEHLRNLVPLMRECHRVLEPGGYLVAVTPYAGSDDAWEDPTHVRAFTEGSWKYFNRHTYEGTGHAGCYDAGVDFTFDVVMVELIPQPEWSTAAHASPDALAYERKTYRNVIQEMRTVLRKGCAA